MARRIVVEFLGKDTSAGSTASKVEQKFGKLGGKLDKVGQAAGKLLAGGLLAGGAAMVKFGQQAGDLAETQSKVNQIFGEEGAAALDKFASTAAAKLGQSKQEALDAAATFGTFGKAAGKTGVELAQFSTGMTTLASDLASFSNTNPAEAAEALGAALRGESEPLRAYGVLLDDATLKAEAMSMGLLKPTKNMAEIEIAQNRAILAQTAYNAAVKEHGKDSTEALRAQTALASATNTLGKKTEGTIGPLTNQQKVLAAQSAIMKQTKDAQGDFAKTSDGLANKQRILKARLADLSTELGAKALPIMTKVVSVGLEMSNWIDGHQRLVGIAIGVIGGFAAVLYTVSLAMRAWTLATTIWSGVTKAAAAVQWLFNTALLASPLTWIVIAIVAVIAAIVLIATKTDWFQQLWSKAWGAIKGAASAVWNWIKGNWPMLLAILTGPIGLAVLFIVRHWDKIKAGATSVKNWIADKFNALVGFFKNMPGRISKAASGMWDGIKNAFKSALNWIVEKWNALDFGIPSFNIPGIGTFGGVSDLVPDVRGFAQGTRGAPPGFAMTGERGPELVRFGGGERVYTAQQTRQMLGGGGEGGSMVVQLKVGARVIEQLLIEHVRSTGRPLQVRTLGPA